MLENGTPRRKRDLSLLAASNRQVNAKNIDIALAHTFYEVANRFKTSNGVPYRDIPRTWDRLIKKLWNWFKANPTASVAAASAPVSLIAGSI